MDQAVKLSVDRQVYTIRDDFRTTLLAGEPPAVWESFDFSLSAHELLFGCPAANDTAPFTMPR